MDGPISISSKWQGCGIISTFIFFFFRVSWQCVWQTQKLLLASLWSHRCVKRVLSIYLGCAVLCCNYNGCFRTKTCHFPPGATVLLLSIASQHFRFFLKFEKKPFRIVLNSAPFKGEILKEISRGRRKNPTNTPRMELNIYCDTFFYGACYARCRSSFRTSGARPCVPNAVLAIILDCWTTPWYVPLPNQQRTFNKLPTELRCRNIVNTHRLSVQIGAKCAKTCMHSVHIPSELPFCMPPLVVGYVRSTLRFKKFSMCYTLVGKEWKEGRR